MADSESRFCSRRQVEEDGGVWWHGVKASQCRGCAIRFNFLKRRHRCRPCGQTFCSSCVPLRPCSGLRSCAHCHTVCICASCVRLYTEVGKQQPLAFDRRPVNDMSMTELHEVFSLELGTRENACNECDDADPSFRCEDCAICLCTQCSVFHRRSRHSRHHHLSELDGTRHRLPIALRYVTQPAQDLLAAAASHAQEAADALVEAQLRHLQARALQLTAHVERENTSWSQFSSAVAEQSEGSSLHNRELGTILAAPLSTAAGPHDAPRTSLPSFALSSQSPSSTSSIPVASPSELSAAVTSIACRFVCS